MPAHPQTITLDSFKGLNNKDKPERTPIDFLKEALNIDIDSAGGIRKREGYSKQISGVFHSLWSNGEDVCLAVKDGDLVRITSNLNTILIKAGVGNDKISYDIIGDDIYFTSISINGILNRNTNKVREWGLQSPNPIPSITSSNGILPSGTFQVVTTFLDKFGRESGASPLQTIDLQKDKSIVLSGFSVPTNSDIISRNIYVSSQNGSHLFLNKTIPINQTTTTIDDTFSNIVPLKTIGVSSAPRGYIVKHAHGRMWVADDKVLWFSDALTYDWFRFSQSYFEFESRIRAIMPTQDGMWVASDRLYYISGKNPETMVRSEKEPIKVVEGSEVKIVGSYLFIENTPIGFKWLISSNEGIFACYNDGITINLTSRNVELPDADFGTGMFMKTGGIDRYLSILQKKSDSNSVSLGDQVTATIIRNGVKVEE